VINDYVTDRMEALTEQDMDVMNTDAISEDIESELESDIQDFDEENYLEGDVLGTRIDFGDVDYQYDDGGTHTLSIPVERHHFLTFDIEEDGSSRPLNIYQAAPRSPIRCLSWKNN